MNDDGEFSLGTLDERTHQAIQELQRTIIERYPSTTFEVVPATDDPESIHVLATADVDGPDEVGDLVLDRVASLIADEGIYVHVIPVRTPERIAAAREAERRNPLRYGSMAS
ncbi:MAG TPA: hypothetical protein VFK36_11890 [Gemmatimonadales bacterium]|nr:hypothetical protein [Gemmatimonadales bacterium]